jgi:hypothetical protein
VWLSSRLRSEDAREIQRVSGKSPEEVLRLSVDLSDEAYTVRLEEHGKPAANPCVVFVVSKDTMNEGMGVCWLLATPDVSIIARPLLRELPYWLHSWESKYPKGVHNLVDTDNMLHVRWLDHMGFAFGQTRDIRGHPFVHAIYLFNQPSNV